MTEAMTTHEIICRLCGKQFTFSVPFEAYKAWLDGELIQNAMPMLTREQRELLKTQICNCMFQQPERGNQ